MRLPDLSYMMTVAGLRYIQSVYEPPERRNPDAMVGELLTPWQRMSCHLRARLSIDALRAQPFYYYLLSRTHHYDQVYRSAIEAGARRIVNIGAGSDTRAYRFAVQLREKGVEVLECDQPRATLIKQRAARRRWRADHVAYAPIDLNHGPWPELEAWLKRASGAKTLVIMEGVSPYVGQAAFGHFLEFLATRLSADSRLAYDFKLPRANDAFGRTDAVRNPFRLSCNPNEVAAYHAARGLRVDRLEVSADLSRLLPSIAASPIPLFLEDALVELSSRDPHVPGRPGV